MHKPYNFTQALKRVIQQHLLFVIGMVVVIVLAVAVALIPPLVLETIVNDLTDGKGVALQLAFLYFGMIAASGILESLQNVCITKFGQSIMHGLRTDMKEKLHRLPASYFTEHSAGEIDSRFVNDIETVDSLFTNGIISMFADAFKVLSILFVIFNRSLGLGLLVLILIPFLMWMTRAFQKRMLRAQMDNRKAVARVNGHIPETIQNMRMITTFHVQKYMEERYDDYIDESFEATDRSNFYDSIYSPIIITLSALMIAVMMICAVSGGSLEALFGISVGSAVAMISYVNKIFDPLESIGMEIQSIQSAIAGVKRIHEFMNAEEREVPNPSNEPKDTNPMIQFDYVQFGYNPERTFLQNLSFQIQEGEAVTFVGRTGAGKSTIFRLLLGLYKPQSGTVHVTNLEADQIPDNKKRSLFGYVEQSFHPIQGTLYEQITLGDPSITMQQVEEAITLVNMKSMIENLPKGYDTPFETTSFSEGQLQLLSIARAIVKNPRILLLDEITANLDSTTETKLLNALKTASEGRTTISISHRFNEAVAETRTIEITPQ